MSHSHEDCDFSQEEIDFDDFDVSEIEEWINQDKESVEYMKRVDFGFDDEESKY